MEDNKKVLDKFSASSLPQWNEIPDLDLYMDQVLSLLTRYLGTFSGSDDKGITSSMINNYVKQGVMPAPQKKRYTRVHLVYLIMIYILKSALTMVQIKSLLEDELATHSLEELYTNFREMFHKTSKEVSMSYEKAKPDALSVTTCAAIHAYIEQSISSALCTVSAK
ncbi:MAG: DUF1836 domain-containing protein [Oscillospiraceae bacterium]|nr:DUF1836 domain-containing protein [Oscillospiraceae bacterium]